MIKNILYISAFIIFVICILVGVAYSHDMLIKTNSFTSIPGVINLSQTPVINEKIITILDLDGTKTIGIARHSDQMFYVIDTNEEVYSLGIPFEQSTGSKYKLFRSLEINKSYHIVYQYDGNYDCNVITSINEV